MYSYNNNVLKVNSFEKILKRMKLYIFQTLLMLFIYQPDSFKKKYINQIFIQMVQVVANT